MEALSHRSKRLLPLRLAVRGHSHNPLQPVVLHRQGGILRTSLQPHPPMDSRRSPLRCNIPARYFRSVQNWLLGARSDRLQEQEALHSIRQIERLHSGLDLTFSSRLAPVLLRRSPDT